MANQGTVILVSLSERMTSSGWKRGDSTLRKHCPLIANPRQRQDVEKYTEKKDSNMAVFMKRFVIAPTSFKTQRSPRASADYRVSFCFCMTLWSHCFFYHHEVTKNHEGWHFSWVPFAFAASTSLLFYIFTVYPINQCWCRDCTLSEVRTGTSPGCKRGASTARTNTAR